MRELTENEKYNVRRELESNGGNIVAAAKNLGIHQNLIAKMKIKDERLFNYTESSFGPKHMQKYLVASRSVFMVDGWDNKNKEIAKARRDYDAGLIELATGRDGEHLLLYAIPRKNTVKRKAYFVTVA